MSLEKERRKRSDFIVTDGGVVFNRKTHAVKPLAINSGGKNVFCEGCIIKADILSRSTNGVSVSLGRLTYFDKQVIIRPSYKFYKKEFFYIPAKVGDNVYIGENSVINAAIIGNNVYIGKNCVIGRGSIIKNCVKILDNTVIPAEAVVSSFTIYQGSPAKQVGELSDFSTTIFEREAKERYQLLLKEIEDGLV